MLMCHISYLISVHKYLKGILKKYPQSEPHELPVSSGVSGLVYNAWLLLNKVQIQGMAEQGIALYKVHFCYMKQIRTIVSKCLYSRLFNIPEETKVNGIRNLIKIKCLLYCLLKDNFDNKLTSNSVLFGGCVM